MEKQIEECIKACYKDRKCLKSPIVDRATCKFICQFECKYECKPCAGLQTAASATKTICTPTGII